MFNPVSPQGQAITNLFNLTLLIGAVILAGIAGAVIYFAIRYRSRGEDEEGQQIFGLRNVEIVWTVGPLLLVGLLAALSVPGILISNPVEATGPTSQPDLIVTGNQWWWEVRYPGANVITANEIHIPIGKTLLVKVQSDDVIHDVWVPQLGPKMDAIPGHPNYMPMHADTPGTYTGACAEYCGTEHAWMLIRVIAQSQADFDAWIKSQQVIPPKPTGGLPAKGLQVLTSNTCVNCHNINGTAAKARVGPDLTHLASRETLAAGRLDNNTANLTAWLTAPQQIKPGVHMANPQLSQTDLQALVAYLETLK